MTVVVTPDVLSMMNTKLDWTLKLDDSVLAQQPDVMDAIQRLRARANANNKLTSTKQQRVTETQEQGRQIIAVEFDGSRDSLRALLRSRCCVRWLAISLVPP